MWIDRLILDRCLQKYVIEVWVPDRVLVVLGSSNEAHKEIDVERCNTDGVEVFKRRGGGGAVVLYPGCVILSVGAWVKRPFDNSFYFERLNLSILRTLLAIASDFATAKQMGISDIAINDRKFCGTSLFRSREFLLFQASLIVDLDSQLIARYLKHPSREPGYRRGRTHDNFLIGLNQIVEGLTVNYLETYFKKAYPKYFLDALGDEIVEVNASHVRYLKPQ